MIEYSLRALEAASSSSNDGYDIAITAIGIYQYFTSLSTTLENHNVIAGNCSVEPIDLNTFCINIKYLNSSSIT